MNKRIIGALIIVATVALSFTLVSIPSERLIALVGTQNVYLFMYLVALGGSITTFASIPYPLVLLGLAAGGINPLAIGLVSALGVCTSDSLTFFAAQKGRVLLSDKLKASLEKVASYVERYPRLVTPGLVLFATFTPLSNDFAVVSLSLMQYKYRQVVIPLAIGNMCANVGVAYLGVYAYDWISNLL
jgi:uncharacterized membrane protein YdjX (TVP38/TMEM64 family)